MRVKTNDPELLLKGRRGKGVRSRAGGPKLCNGGKRRVLEPGFLDMSLPKQSALIWDSITSLLTPKDLHCLKTHT